MRHVHLVTQAYGSCDVRTQALYAAWSALTFAERLPGCVLHVYTDDAASFAPLEGRIAVRVVSLDEIRAWRGPHDFVHRLKAEVIREMASRFPGEPLLYFDADVFFTGPIAAAFDRIGPGRSVMHEREYSVATHSSPQMRKFRRRMGGLTFRGRPIDLSRDMWNAGALGIDPAQFVILDEWIEFIDEVYPHYKRSLVEQYAISVLLQREATVAPADDLVFHYWFQKDDYVAAIERELDVLRTRPFAESLAHLRANRIRLPFRKQRSTFVDRMQRIWTGKG